MAPAHRDLVVLRPDRDVAPHGVALRRGAMRRGLVRGSARWARFLKAKRYINSMSEVRGFLKAKRYINSMSEVRGFLKAKRYIDNVSVQ
ncbi:hypothetical protein [Sorangium sp. So ce381]|uniref:hypothetical protein n=1 Tax=Sorangium sp. So ce381 TaxID=3133307 RepID=UPI003F5B1916